MGQYIPRDIFNFHSHSFLLFYCQYILSIIAEFIPGTSGPSGFPWDAWRCQRCHLHEHAAQCAGSQWGWRGEVLRTSAALTAHPSRGPWARPSKLPAPWDSQPSTGSRRWTGGGRGAAPPCQSSSSAPAGRPLSTRGGGWGSFLSFTSGSSNEQCFIKNNLLFSKLFYSSSLARIICYSQNYSIPLV